jgi:uncharacterized protein (TIGR02611 family)
MPGGDDVETLEDRRPAADAPDRDGDGSDENDGDEIVAVPAPYEHHLDDHVLRELEDGDRWSWRRRIRRNPVALFWYRIGVGILGLLVMVAAAVTGPLPGPGGIPLFLLGLAIWATEFAWAHQLLQWFTQWFRKVGRLSRRSKVLLTIAIIAVALASAYGSLAFFGPPSWLPGFLQRWLRLVPGIS